MMIEEESAPTTTTRAEVIVGNSTPISSVSMPSIGASLGDGTPHLGATGRKIGAGRIIHTAPTACTHGGMATAEEAASRETGLPRNG